MQVLAISKEICSYGLGLIIIVTIHFGIPIIKNYERLQIKGLNLTTTYVYIQKIANENN